MTDPKVVVVDEQGAVVAPEPRKRLEQIIVGLKDGEAPWDGDILVVLAPPASPSKTKTKHGSRMSVRPRQEKCACKGRGWGVMETDDGSRFKRRVPGLCACISQAVAKICGADSVIASWAMSVDDPVLVAWREELAVREEAAVDALATVQTERRAQVGMAEAEAAKIEAAAKAAEPEASEAAQARSAARDAVAGAVTAEGQARAILKDAEKTLIRARKELAAAEVAHSMAAHKVDRTGAARLRATAAIIGGGKGEWADRERRAVAAVERVRREVRVAAGLGVRVVGVVPTAGVELAPDAATTKPEAKSAEQDHGA
jgi:hypothetical protein